MIGRGGDRTAAPPGRRPGRQAKSAGLNARGSTSTSQLPEMSRMTASTPYGRSEGSCRNSTPLADSSSKVLRQSSTVSPSPPFWPFSSWPPDERGGLVVQRRAGHHQGDVQLRLALVPDGHPAEALPHRDVGARCEAEDVDVEVAGLVLVEAVDGHQ